MVTRRNICGKLLCAELKNSSSPLLSQSVAEQAEVCPGFTDKPHFLFVGSKLFLPCERTVCDTFTEHRCAQFKYPSRALIPNRFSSRCICSSVMVLIRGRWAIFM